MITPDDPTKTAGELQAEFMAGAFVRSDDWRWVFTKRPDNDPLPKALAPMLVSTMTAAECSAYVESNKAAFTNRYPTDGGTP